MAKGKSRPSSRRLPTTPAPAPEELSDGPDAAQRPIKLAHQSSGSPVPADEGDTVTGAELWPDEPLYLINGTGCVAGHERGSELIGGKLGKVPSQRTTRIGVGLIIWLLLGIVFLSNLLWLALALIGGMTWMILSASVQRRSGHRGHCWRTRAWRYAWGGLVPMPRLEDPTREAE